MTDQFALTDGQLAIQDMARKFTADRMEDWTKADAATARWPQDSENTTYAFTTPAVG